MWRVAVRSLVGLSGLALLAAGCADAPDEVATTGVERIAGVAPTTEPPLIDAGATASPALTPTLPPTTTIAATTTTIPAPAPTPTTTPTATSTATSTAPPTPTTTTTTSTTATVPDAGCCGEGRLEIFVTAKSAFDVWTSGGHWDWMNEHYDSMVVWEPYWDSRLDSYDDVTVYRDAYAIKTNTDKDRRSVDHPDWLLRDAAGDPVYIPFACNGGCPQFAADVGNPAFRDDWIARVQASVDRGYRGLLIDDVNMLWRFSDVNGGDIEPIDPRTGAVLTLADWQRYMTEFMEQVRAAFPQLEIWHNSIWYADSPTFDNALVDRQIRAADVIQLERGMNDLGLKSGTSKYGMQTFMTFIDRVHANGAGVALLDENAVDIQGQWYNIAGGLLVNNGRDLVTTEDWDLIAPGGLFDGYLTDLGHALGPRAVVDGTIQREFTGGLVVMNEPRSDPVTVDLGGSWLTPEGDAVTSVTLDTREAIVLTRP
ncbi:MAG: putative glycoside hydrolase [Acidimicrobiales bacterium]|nr:putative glycoside hydrolase [Acidimicrobiales bacterium]